jgi:FkbM family methyltransferase
MMRARLRHLSAAMMRSAVFPGRYKAYRLLSRILGEEPLPFAVPLPGGGKLSVNSTFWQHMFYLGDYEYEVRRFLVRQIQLGSTVFDVGASIGICTVPLAIRLGQHGRIYAFEALASNYESLLRNIKLNNLANVVPVFAAVADKQGTVNMPDVDSGNCSLASQSDRYSSVTAITLDEFAAQHRIDSIDLMKIDIEGSETKALRGASRLLSSGAIRHILIEFNPYWLKRMGSSPAELYDLFEQSELVVNFLTRFGTCVRTNRKSVMRRITSPDSYFNLVLTSSKNALQAVSSTRIAPQM